MQHKLLARSRTACAADLPPLAQLTGLRALALPNSPDITSGGLQQLSALVQLTSLDLSGALISAPRGLITVLSSFPQLRRLRLAGCKCARS